MASKRIGIIGASGYTGAELLRLCAQHPGFEVALATGDTQAGKLAASRYPSLAAAYPDLVFDAVRARRVSTASTSCSSACPTRRRRRIVPELRGKVGCIVDLSADFRLKDAALYPQWYGSSTHQARAARRSSCTACPSCTATTLIGSRAGRHARLLRDGGVAGAGAARARRRRRAERASSSTPPAACRAPGAG